MTKNTNIKNTIAATTISLALVAGLAPTAAFAVEAPELPIAVTMAAQSEPVQETTQEIAEETTQETTQTITQETTAVQIIAEDSSSDFADTLHALIAEEAAKVYAAQAQAQGLGTEAVIATLYNA